MMEISLLINGLLAGTILGWLAARKLHHHQQQHANYQPDLDRLTRAIERFEAAILGPAKQDSDFTAPSEEHAWRESQIQEAISRGEPEQHARNRIDPDELARWFGLKP